jgi:hypothetical protein
MSLAGSTISFKLAATGEMQDFQMNVPQLGNVTTAVNSALAEMMKGSVRNMLPQYKLGGFRQGEVVSATDMKQFSTEIPVDGKIILTMAGIVAEGDRTEYLLNVSGSISASGVNGAFQGYMLTDAATGLFVVEETQILLEKPRGHLAVIMTRKSITTPTAVSIAPAFAPVPTKPVEPVRVTNPPSSTPTQRAPAGSAMDLSTRLKQLDDAFRQNLITRPEYDAKRRSIIDGM